MDIEKLIERLRHDANAYRNGDTLGRAYADQEDVLDRAVDALSTLQAENEKLRAELEQVKRALAMMWFAYVNSDREDPHNYETEALEEAERLLGLWKECMPKYLRRGPQDTLSKTDKPETKFVEYDLEEE